jgi:hypothetical protein
MTGGMVLARIVDVMAISCRGASRGEKLPLFSHRGDIYAVVEKRPLGRAVLYRPFRGLRKQAYLAIAPARYLDSKKTKRV